MKSPNEPTSILGMWPRDSDITASGEGTPRARALSLVVAADVEWRYPAIDWFRMDHLPGGYVANNEGDAISVHFPELLAPGKLDEWIRALPESKRPFVASWLCDIPFESLTVTPEGSYLIPPAIVDEAMNGSKKRLQEASGDSVALDGVPRQTTRILRYLTPQRGTLDIPIRVANGVLETLRTLVRSLPEVRDGIWQEEQATTFVLTGYAPLVDEQCFPFPSQTGRRQSEKALQLAAFAAQRPGLTVKLLMEQWNARYPAWAYQNVSHFGQDSRLALRRLTGKPLFAPSAFVPNWRQLVVLAREEARRKAGGDLPTDAIWTVDVRSLVEEAALRIARPLDAARTLGMFPELKIK